MTPLGKLLGDFAPALSLLPAAERRRAEGVLESLVGRREGGEEPPRQPATLADAEAAAERRVAEFWRAYRGTPPAPELLAFGAALVRLRALQDLGPALAAGRCPLPETAVPDAFERPALRRLVAAVRAECGRLRPRLLGVGSALPALPEPAQRATVYLLLAALRLLARLEEADTALLDRPPRLPPWTRTALVARARWKGLEAV